MVDIDFLCFKYYCVYVLVHSLRLSFVVVFFHPCTYDCVLCEWFKLFVIIFSNFAHMKFCFGCVDLLWNYLEIIEMIHTIEHLIEQRLKSVPMVSMLFCFQNMNVNKLSFDVFQICQNTIGFLLCECIFLSWFCDYSLNAFFLTFSNFLQQLVNFMHVNGQCLLVIHNCWLWFFVFQIWLSICDWLHHLPLLC